MAMISSVEGAPARRLAKNPFDQGAAAQAQQPVRQQRRPEQTYVTRPALLRGRLERFRETAGMRTIERDQPLQRAQASRGEGESEQTAPIVADQHDAARARGVDQPGDIGEEIGQSIILAAARPARAAIAALVDRPDAKALGEQRPHLAAPLQRALRKAMQQQREALASAGLEHLEVEPVGGDDDAPRAENLLDASQFAPPKLMSSERRTTAAGLGRPPSPRRPARRRAPSSGRPRRAWRSAISGGRAARLPHSGQAGNSFERTRVSNSCAQSAQA